MNSRISQICSHLGRGKTFADVGCDHGYCAEYALENNLFETVYISDISAGSLKKAEELLAEYVQAGRCIPVLADGMQGLPEGVDVLLIAGLGGEEIIKILREGYLPKRFVFQPMKNAEKLRSFLVESGAKITADYTFGEGYFYDLIAGEDKGGSSYTEREILFGKDNLKTPTPSFLHKLEEERRKLLRYLEEGKMSGKNREKLSSRLKEVEDVIHEITGNL